MRHSLFIFAVLFFAVVSAAGKAGEKSDAGDESAKSISPVAVSMNDDWQFVMPLESDIGFGYLSGYGTTEVSGVFVEANLSLSPGFLFRKRLLQLALTLAYDSREALGFDLDDRHPHGGMSLRFRPDKRIDMGIETDGGMRFRPGWIDLYQPIAGANNEYTGRFRRTDRNSYGHVGGDLYFRYRFSKQYSGEMYGGHEYLSHVPDSAPQNGPVIVHGRPPGGSSGSAVPAMPAVPVAPAVPAVPAVPTRSGRSPLASPRYAGTARRHRGPV